MTRLNLLPPAALRRYVRAIQYMDAPPSDDGFVIPAQERSTLILPDHVDYALEGEIADRVTLCSATLLGPHDAPIVNRTCRPVRGFTVDFTPLGLVELLGVPQGELANRGVPADEVLSWAWVRALTERIHEARSVSAAVDVICRALLEVQRQGPLTEGSRIVRAALGRGGRVRPLAESLGVSERHLNREFHRMFGIGPRRYAVIERIQRAMAALAQEGPRDLSLLAAELGFFDYSHFSSEFKRFTLTTPREFGDSQRHRESRVVASSPIAP